VATAPDEGAAGFFRRRQHVDARCVELLLRVDWPPRKYFNTGDLLRFGCPTAVRVVRRREPGDVSEARQAALSFVAGRRVDQLRDLSEEIFDELMAERIWSGTHALANCTSTPDKRSGWSPPRRWSWARSSHDGSDSPRLSAPSRRSTTASTTGGW